VSFLSFIKAIGDFFLPQVCTFCGNPGLENGRYPVCEACIDGFIPIVPPYCTRCGEPFPGISDMHLCGECIKDPPPFETARSLFVFKERARDLVLRLKFRKDLSTLSVLEHVLTRHTDTGMFPADIDLIVPVPLDKSGLRRRGYNQALLMADCLAKHLHKPIDRVHLVKLKKTPPQIGLTRAQRRRNIQGAFSVKGRNCFLGKTILLVDDVFTTGATVRSCSRVLLQAGARLVRVLTFARTVPE